MPMSGMDKATVYLYSGMLHVNEKNELQVQALTWVNLKNHVE